MLVMHFGHRDPEMHSHDATSYYAAIRPASAALHHYAVRHSSHNDFTPGCVACFARTTPGYRGLLDPAFGSPVSSQEEIFFAEGPSMDQRPNLVGVGDQAGRRQELPGAIAWDDQVLVRADPLGV